MEELSKIWAIVMPYFTNTAVMGVIMAVVTAIIKGSINKKFNDTDMNKLFDKSYNRVIGKVKDVSFLHDIQPLVESRLQKIQEEAISQLQGELTQMREISKQQSAMLFAFMQYFDNSVGVSEDKKAEVKAMYGELQGLYDDKGVTPVESQVVVEEAKPQQPTNTIEIER